MAKFIFVPLTRPFNQTQFEMVMFYSMLKKAFLSVVLFPTKENELIVGQVKDPVLGAKSMLTHDYAANWTDIEAIFPDKVKNLKGYSLGVMLSPQPPRIWYANNKFFGIDSYFLNEMANQLNGSSHAKYYIYKTGMSLNNFHNADFSLITGLPVEFGKGTLVVPVPSYEFDGYCALVPITPGRSLLYDLITPFDGPTWFFMFLAILAVSFLWNFVYRKKLTQSPNSTGYFLFSIYGFFFGQSIPMIKLCLIQTCILQLFVLLTFVLGNVYQSEVIASLIKYRNGTSIKTLSELMQSDLKLIVDPFFYNMSVQSNFDSNFQKNLIKLDESTSLEDLEKYYARNLGIVSRCDIGNFLLYSTNSSSSMYHIIQEKFYLTTEFYTISAFSPFYDKLVFYISAVFESGIKSYWKYLNTLFLNSKKWKVSTEPEPIVNNENILKMAELQYIFMGHLIGLFIAFVVFLGEHIHAFWVKRKFVRI